MTAVSYSSSYSTEQYLPHHKWSVNKYINTFFILSSPSFYPQAKSENGIASQLWAAGDYLIRESVVSFSIPHQSSGGVSGEHSKEGFLLIKDSMFLALLQLPWRLEQGGWTVSFSGEVSKPFCRASATLIWVITNVWEPSYSVNFFTRCWKKENKTHCFSSNQNCCQKHFRSESYSWEKCGRGGLHICSFNRYLLTVYQVPLYHKQSAREDIKEWINIV